MADAQKKQGVTTEDKGTYIPPSERAPYDPENLRRSKKQFIEAQRIRKEKELKIKEYASKLDEELADKKAKIESEVSLSAESNKEKGKPGRKPKNID
jgi:hypothetical protein